ncbi:MAG TPA: acetyl-CoA carboxylase biotin carboxyl carrier protein [Gemmatimonadales bacterium]
MKLDIIRQLVQILKEAPEVGAIEIRRGPFGAWSSVRVSKAGHGVGATNAGGHIVVAHPLGIPNAGPAIAAPQAVGEGAGGAGGAGGLLEIKSPMVGTFYNAPEPGAPPYVKVGSRVSPGQILCIIEAMKIMNHFEAEIAGVIREVAIENAQPVEFGQVLFRVDPHG